MARILNIIHSLTVGGAARTMIATAKYSARCGPYNHALAILDLKHTDPGAVEFAMGEGIEIPIVRNHEELSAEIERADIVQVNWWQHPDMDAFFRSDLPPMRLIGWFHCAGDSPPQYVTDQLVDFCDLALGGSSYTYECPAFQTLPASLRAERTGYVIGGADLSRVAAVVPRPHGGFNVGYIGTVNPVKMHRDFIELHSGIAVEGLKVIVCGGDRHLILKQKAEELGVEARFDFRGYVADIAPVLAELDVYGYPLCPDTYAASELNLQEAMAAGLPAVVFPYGGLKTMVIDDFNGLVVRSAAEYGQAIEYLYRNPQERLRMGRNAKYFAETMFGAERNAPRMNRFYEALLKKEKRQRRYKSILPPAGSAEAPPDLGCRLFIESLGGTRREYEISLDSEQLGSIFAAEALIARGSELMCRGGVLPYAGSFHREGLLQLWGGLLLFGLGDRAEAAKYFLRAIEAGIGRFGWRPFWYIALCGVASKDLDLARMALRKAADLAPDFSPAPRLREMIDGAAPLPADLSYFIDPFAAGL